jgi:hypothetical protein
MNMDQADPLPESDEFRARMDSESQFLDDDDSDAMPLLAHEKRIVTLRFDLDTVKAFGLKGAVFAKYLECWLHGKVTRRPEEQQWTYDARWLICQRTGLKSSTLFRITERMKKKGFLRIKRGRKQMLQYALKEQESYFKSRKNVRRVYCSRDEADKYGEPVAILLHNLRYWLSQDQEPWRLYAGRYWRYSGLTQLNFHLQGFLSKDQIQEAVKFMVDEGLILKIDFYDRLGVYWENAFWITLKSTNISKQECLENRIRWPGLKVRKGGLEVVSEGRKTARQNGKTETENDKTETSINTLHPIHNERVNEHQKTPLNIDSLTAPVADAPSALYRNSLNESLPQSHCHSVASPRRATPTTEPAGASLTLPLTESALECEEDVLSQVSTMEGTYVIQRQTDPKPAKESLPSPVNLKESVGEVNVKELVKNPFARVNYNYHFKQDLKSTEHLISVLPDDAAIFRMEIERARANQKPKDCFAAKFSNRESRCSQCSWRNSCSDGTSLEIKREVQEKEKSRMIDTAQQRTEDNEYTVRKTYRETYQIVFGEPPTDSIGKASRVYDHASELKISVRYFCLIYMRAWANTHPKQRFYQRYMIGDSAANMVRQAVEVSITQFGTITENSLAMLSGCDLEQGIPVWRHKPTPVEEVMDVLSKAFKDLHGSEYTFEKKDIDTLVPYFDNLENNEIAKVTALVANSLRQPDPPKSFMQAVRRNSGIPEPEPKIEWPSCKGLLDDEVFQEDELVDCVDYSAYIRKRASKQIDESQQRKESPDTKGLDPKEDAMPGGKPNTAQLPKPDPNKTVTWAEHIVDDECEYRIGAIKRGPLALNLQEATVILKAAGQDPEERLAFAQRHSRKRNA